MSRQSVLSMLASRSARSGIPLRAYFLWAGAGLLLLLCAADWVLPAALPSRSAAADRAMPPIRIHSDVKGPELVVIDTNQPARVLADKDIEASAHLENADAADAVQEPVSLASVDGSESGPATSMTPRVRESLAQSIADHDGARAMTEPRPTSAHARSGKRRRVAGHLRPSGTLGRCNAFSGGACRYALKPSYAD